MLAKGRVRSVRDKKRTLLLGAGASAEAGVPVATKMTTHLHDLSSKGLMDVDVEVFRFVAGGNSCGRALEATRPLGALRSKNS